MTNPTDRLRTALADRYRIERELGQGGMATVYLADDLRHRRKVALKVLRPELAAVIGVERFLNEITTTANLQHPHILPLHDSGEVNGTVFYVMPYVEGESLRDRLQREKQLPIPDAVRIANEVASALDYAHRRGVIHRDIKPENILLHEGRAQVADFGIALAVSRSDGGTRMTETGMSLGTPHYMAPEQAMGEREITARADIYALGCVLYEMLSGEPPFSGPTAQAIIARVMTEEPRSLTLQRRTIPPHVEAAVFTALAKLPADRFTTAAQLGEALGNPGFTSATTTRSAAVARPRSPRARILGATPWVLVALLGGYAVVGKLRSAPDTPLPPLYRFTVELPPDKGYIDQTGPGIALSVDGTMLAYNGRDSLGTRLFLRPLAQLESVPINGALGAGTPFFSPDGRWIGFVLNNRILRAPVGGGVAEKICDIATSGVAPAPTWLTPDVVVFTAGTGLRQCSGGIISDLFQPDSSKESAQITWPHALPGGHAVVYTNRLRSVDRLTVFDLRSHRAHDLGVVGSDARYVGSGYLVYGNQDGVIRAVPFDTAQLKVTGQPVVITEAPVGTGGAAKLAVSVSGLLVTSGLATGRASLEILDRKGRAEPAGIPDQPYGEPRFSPDGRRIAVVVGPGSGASNIWVLDRQEHTFSRLTFDSSATRPIWSADGRRILYLRELSTTNQDVRIINADGSAPADSFLTPTGMGVFEASMAHDGRSMVVRTFAIGAGRDLYRVALDSGRVMRPLLVSPADETSPSLSPDGHWIAYVSDESGRQEVYVRSYPAMGARYQISLEGGIEAAWSPAGNEIFYRTGSYLMAAQVRVTRGFEVLSRSALFATNAYDFNSFGPTYDVAPDGQHFVMVRRFGQANGLIATLNWFDRQRADRSSGR